MAETGKTCPKCKKTKPPAQFYGDKTSGDGRSCWCKTCIDAKPRKLTNARLIRNRVRQRASQLLIELHREEFEKLHAACLQEATREAAKLADDERVAAIFPKGVSPRLRPGPSRGRSADGAPERVDEPARVDRTWCGTCREYHRNNHRHVVPVKLTAEELIEDVIQIRLTEKDFDVIASRMHMTPAALEIALRRAGRGDLARRNQAAAS